MPQLRIFEVPPPGPDGKPQAAVEWPDRITVAASGDAAKRGARLHLESLMFEVRSINWGPGPHGKPNELVAYVMKKAG